MSRFNAKESRFETYAAPLMLAGVSAFLITATAYLVVGGEDAMSNASPWLAKVPLTAPAKVQVADNAMLNQHAKLNVGEYQRKQGVLTTFHG